MKKVLTLLMVMALTVVSVFADDSETFKSPYSSTIYLNTEVKPVAPVFEVFASTSDDFTSSVKGGETLTVGNPATNDIKVNFRLAQTNITRYKEAFNVSITAAQFAGEFNSNNVTSTVVPVAAKGSTYSDSNSVVSVTSENVTTNTYTSVLTYAEKKAVNPIENLLTMNFTWAKDDTLPATTYKSSISINISVNN